MFPPRLRSLANHPLFWPLLVWVAGVALRIEYTLHINPPEKFVTSDMYFYVQMAKRLIGPDDPLQPWDVTHPLGYPALIAFLISGGGSLARVANFQMVVSSLVPLAVGLLGAAAYGRRAGLLALVFASIYFPFIEYGALFLSEIHFILWMALAFAAFFGASRVRTRWASLLLAAGGGLALSVAIAMKSVAVLAAVTFFAVEALAILLRDAAGARAPGWWRARLAPWVLRCAVVAVAAAPLLGVLARVCTRANRGNFCLTGNKVGSDFLLGHYGRIADMEWAADQGHGFRFGSPGSYLRHYEHHAKVPFFMTDNAANSAEAWRWIGAHPFEAFVLSLDHIYDAFFGVAMWPSYGHPSWPNAHLAQYIFVVVLLIPTLFACRELARRRGARAFVTSRTALVLAPIFALTVTVAIATGEVRYRIPFDIFFMALVCAYVSGDFARVEGLASTAPNPAVPTAPTDPR